jgi:sarcosine oxidase
MSRSWDVVVVGLGAMGSAVVCELARRGYRVLGLDRYTPPHAMGSSHGASRIIREAYFEHPQYVPLVHRAYERWTALEAESGTPLLQPTGGLMIGPPDGVLVAGARASADLHGLAYDVLSGSRLETEYPAFTGVQAFVAIREPRAGVHFPERCVAAHLAVAANHGADLRTGIRVEGWQAEGGTIDVRAGAERFTGGALVLAAGPWVRTLVPGLDLPLTVARQVQHWFAPGTNAARFEASRFPIFLLEHEPGAIVYGFPAIEAAGHGVKVARHHFGRLVDADTVDRDVQPDEIEAMSPLLERFLPDLAGGWSRSEVCLYTNTPDLDFLIDRHPAHANVLIVSACSGHGFKFSSAIGEVVADLVAAGRSAFDLTPFRWGRFSTS